jgi:Putative ABC exporter
MHPALLTLILLQGKALMRRSARAVRSPRGLVFLVLAIVLLTLWLLPGIMRVYVAGRLPPAAARTAFPLAMLALCAVNLITSVNERAVAFLPAEVDLLFAGPFSRRELLGYKLLKSALGAVFTASIFSILFARYTQFWAAGWLGIFLALLFQQLFSTSVVLIGQTIGERAYTRGRALLLAALVVLAVIAMAPALRSERTHSLAELATMFRGSIIGGAVLAPFDVFARIVVAPALVPDALGWIALALAMIALMVLLVTWLDAQYLETAATAGRRLHARLQRVRRGMGPLRASRRASLGLPRPPRLGGAGPIAWRQLTTALRQSRGVVLMLVVICGAFALMLNAVGFGERGSDLTGVVVGGLAWLTFMFSNVLRFDFRGDVDHVDGLKALPVPAVAISAGQLVAPVAVMAVCQVCLLAVMTLALAPPFRLILAALAFIVPFDILLVAVENLIFLVFPTRMNPVTPGDLEGWGRQMLVFLMKMAALTVLCGIAVGLGLAVSMRGIGPPPGVFAATTLAVMLVEALAFLPLLALAFRHFDPSVNTPA